MSSSSTQVNRITQLIADERAKNKKLQDENTQLKADNEQKDKQIQQSGQNLVILQYVEKKLEESLDNLGVRYTNRDGPKEKSDKVAEETKKFSDIML